MSYTGGRAARRQQYRQYRQQVLGPLPRRCTLVYVTTAPLTELIACAVQHDVTRVFLCVVAHCAYLARFILLSLNLRSAVSGLALHRMPLPA